MHAYSHYVVAISGTDEDVSAGVEFLKEETLEDLEDNRIVFIDENYEIVWLEDLITLAEKLAKQIPESKFVFSGFVDCTESCGEVMQFGIIYENGELKVYNTDWVYLDDDLEEVYYNLDSYVTEDEELIEVYFQEIISDIQAATWDNTETFDV